MKEDGTQWVRKEMVFHAPPDYDPEEADNIDGLEASMDNNDINNSDKKTQKKKKKKAKKPKASTSENKAGAQNDSEDDEENEGKLEVPNLPRITEQWSVSSNSTLLHDPAMALTGAEEPEKYFKTFTIT
jgi:hypothetical protein